MDPFALPPTIDCAPEFCFCGRKTVESHEFWFCSTKCARLDSLRSLDNPQCHYRNVVQAHVRAGGPQLPPHRMMSADCLRPSEQRGFANAPPPFVPPTNLPHQGSVTSARRAAWNRNMTGFPTLSQLTGKVLTRKATTREPLAAERHDRPRWEDFPNVSRARAVQRQGDHSFEQISLDAIPQPEYAPVRSLRRVPSSVNGLGNHSGKPSVAAQLLNFSRSRKMKEDENPERIFGHSVDPIIPPVRKESLPWNRHANSAVPVETTKALRRSASLAGWNATPHSADGPRNEQDSLMRIIEEIKEELSDSFNPRSFFDLEEYDSD